MTIRRAHVLLATATTVAAVAVTATLLAADGDSPRRLAEPGAATSPPTSASSSQASTRTTAPVPLSDQPAPGPVASPSAGSRPVRVRIPAIGVDSSLESLGVTRAGVLATPSKWQRAGWYSDGIRPGMTGPAVIAGHVDSKRGPAVFYRLGRLDPGDRVVVTRADRRQLTFVVDGTREYPKRSFPTQAVYGPTSLPVLRLITCAGDFDAGKSSYVDNLVVTSHLVTR